MEENQLPFGMSTIDTQSTRIHNRSLADTQEQQQVPIDTEEDSPGALDAFTNQIDENWIIPNVVRGFQNVNSRYNADEEFLSAFSYEALDKDLKELGLDNIPENWKEDYQDVTNAQSYQDLKQRHLELWQDRQELEKLGGLTQGAVIVGSYVTDPLAFAAEAKVALGTTGSLMKRILTGGGRAVGVETGLELLRSADDTIDVTDFAIGMSTAFVLGGGIGALTGDALKAQDILKNTLKESRPGSELTNGTGGAARNLDLPDYDSNIPINKSSIINKINDDIDAEGLIENTAFSKLEVSPRAFLQKSESPVVRKLGEKLLGYNVQKDKNAVRKLDALQRKQIIDGKHDGLLKATLEPEYNSWAKEFRKKGKIRADYDYEGIELFNHEVGKVVMTGKTDGVPPQILKSAAATKKFFSSYIDEFERTGVLKKGQVPKNDDYLPRIPSYEKIQKIRREVGHGFENSLVKLAKKALIAGRQQEGLEISEEISEKVAKAVVKMWTKPKSGGFQRVDDISRLNLDDKEVLEELASKLDPEDFADFKEALDAIKRPEVKKGSPRLEHRLPMDMNTSVTLNNGRQLHLHDVLETDVEKLTRNYGKWASAETALHEQGLSVKKLKDGIEELRVHADSNINGDLHGVPTPKDISYLEHARDSLLDISPDVDNKLFKPGTAMHSLGLIAGGLTYATKMGLSGANAIIEAGTLLATGQAKAAFKTFPLLRRFTKDVIDGKADGELVKQLHMLNGGVARTWLRNSQSLKQTAEILEHSKGKLGKVEAFTESFKRTATRFNGLSAITDKTREMATNQGLNLLDEIAHGKKMPKWWNKRSKDWTLSDERAELVSNFLRTSPLVKRGKAGEISDLGYYNMPNDVRTAFEDFLYSFTTSMIQETSRGVTPRWMQRLGGRLVGQFRGFTSNAWENHVIKDLHFRDRLGSQKLVATAALGMLVEAAKVYVEHPFEPEKREELLSLSRLARDGATYAVNIALLPDLIDTVASPFLGDNVIGRQRTSGLDSNLIGGVPAMSLATDAESLSRLLGDLLRGGEIDRSQVKALSVLSLLDSFWFTRGVRNYLMSEAPSSRSAEKNVFNPFSEE